jgi:hypothetical protein
MKLADFQVYRLKSEDRKNYVPGAPHPPALLEFHDAEKYIVPEADLRGVE